MRFFLLNKLSEATRLENRVAVDLAAQQNENTGCDGEDRQDHVEAFESWDKRKQAKGNQEDAQQQHAYTLGEFQFHGGIPF
jgi:hypothetical protein